MGCGCSNKSGQNSYQKRVQKLSEKIVNDVTSTNAPTPQNLNDTSTQIKIQEMIQRIMKKNGK